MLFGHIGVGLAAKRMVPKISLFILIPVSLICDILAILRLFYQISGST
jgi:hypothetical protein